MYGYIGLNNVTKIPLLLQYYINIDILQETHHEREKY
jgi:hypothetical protein